MISAAALHARDRDKQKRAGLPGAFIAPKLPRKASDPGDAYALRVVREQFVPSVTVHLYNVVEAVAEAYRAGAALKNKTVATAMTKRYPTVEAMLRGTMPKRAAEKLIRRMREQRRAHAVELNKLRGATTSLVAVVKTLPKNRDDVRKLGRKFRAALRH